MKRIKGKYLEFISRIKADGSGTVPPSEDMSFCQEEYFDVRCLSITNDTWIAANMATYVVKIKKQPDELEDALTDFMKHRKLTGPNKKLLKDFGQILWNKKIEQI